MLKESGYNKGFTMIEVIMVVIITGILITVALKSVVLVTETTRVEETKQELEALAFAICGNPELENNGVRTDFGYVGDIGALPGGLDSLHNRPAGYTTWKGPYIENRFAQITDDYKQDAWGTAYTYTGTQLISTGGGSDIVRKLANDNSDLLYNMVTGVIVDHDGAPPGPEERDSVVITLTFPNGASGYVEKSIHPDASGYFSFDSIPIGNHDIKVIYRTANDTLYRFVSVLPNSVLYQEYFLTFSPWSEIQPTEGCFEYVEGSGKTIREGAGVTTCNGIEFQVTNICGEPAYVTSLTLDFVSIPPAYFQSIKWDNEQCFNGNPDRVGSGEVAEFVEPTDVEWVSAGVTITVKIYTFKDTRSMAGDEVPMNDIDVTVTLSDGSTFTFYTGDCAES